MKNNNQNEIIIARQNRSHKAAANTDILVIPHVAQGNMQRLSKSSRRKRRTNYVKKIMNDPFIFNV